MSNLHTVTVGYLPIEGDTALAYCSCACWRQRFSHGEREDAIAAGAQHIADVSGRMTIDASSYDGTTTLIQGQSF